MTVQYQAVPLHFATKGTVQAATVGEKAPLRRLSVCLINPRFEPSFWGMQFILHLFPGDKRCSIVTNALPTLAGLAPAHCDIELLDENVEEIDFARLARFDVIGLTGMLIQRQRMLEILERLQGLPAMVIVGGPFATVSPNELDKRCDAIFIGEAEQTWPLFLTDLARGLPLQRRYQQAARSDMEKVPPPRYDLLKNSRYTMAALQFSRGCPFLCEFCDIITTFGRTPRLKTTEQMIAEFDVILAAGFNSCFLVDDNFIGNRKRAKELLKALIAWQERHGYPLRLCTEASINLADDPEMLELMQAANMQMVFIGIESPNQAALEEIRKVQNVRGDGLQAKIARIRDAGLIVQAGFIVGFDHDTPEIFDQHFDFIQASGIANAIPSMLTPIPRTPLYDRLSKEGRLDFNDPDVIFEPAGMSRETLKAGYARLRRRLFEPDVYFERLFRGYAGSPEFRRQRQALQARQSCRRASRPGWAAALPSFLATGRMLLGLAKMLLENGELARFSRIYLATWRRWNRPLGAAAMPLPEFIRVCLSHWHYYKISTYTLTNIGRPTAQADK